MTLAEPLMHLLSAFLPSTHPGPLYYRALSFIAVFGIVFGLARYLRITYVESSVECYRYADYIGGAALGFVNGLVIGGVLLVFWSMLPFVKYIPSDFGRVETTSVPLDPGAAMLRLYSRTAQTMGGRRPFLLQPEPILLDEDEYPGLPDATRDIDGDGEDEPVAGESYEDLNGNGQWDRGWMWNYRRHADFTVDDISRVAGEKRSGD
jgi:hypothetical protein